MRSGLIGSLVLGREQPAGPSPVRAGEGGWLAATATAILLRGDSSLDQVE